MCFVGCNSVAAVAVVSAAIGVTGSTFCGVFCSHQDISPQFAGTLYGVTNTLANITGFLAPAVIGFITYNNVRRVCLALSYRVCFLVSIVDWLLRCT